MRVEANGMSDERGMTMADWPATAAEMGLMEGYPAPPEKQVTRENLTVGVPVELPKTAAGALPTEQEEPLTITLTAVIIRRWPSDSTW